MNALVIMRNIISDNFCLVFHSEDTIYSC